MCCSVKKGCDHKLRMRRLVNASKRTEDGQTCAEPLQSIECTVEVLVRKGGVAKNNPTRYADPLP